MFKVLNEKIENIKNPILLKLCRGAFVLTIMLLVGAGVVTAIKVVGNPFSANRTTAHERAGAAVTSSKQIDRGENLLFSWNFSNGLGSWDDTRPNGGAFSLFKYDNGQAVKITRNYIENEKETFLRYGKLPINALRGKRVLVRAMVRADNIEVDRKDVNYFGGHLDLEITPAKGDQQYPSVTPYIRESKSWMPVSFDCIIPMNAQDVTLRMGLQGARGTIYFDDLKVIVVNK
jgi:hypothetical protein